MNTPLRVSVIITDKYELPAWEHEMLQQLIRDDLVGSISFIGVRAKPLVRESLIYRLFKKFEDWWFQSIPDAFKMINAKKEYPDAEFISPEESKSIAVDFTYISCLADKNYTPGRGSPVGVWSVIFGNETYKDAEPWAFWEVMNDEVIAGSMLQVIFPGKQDPLIVYKGVTNTVPYSVKNSLNCLAWKSSSFMKYRLRELIVLGPEQFSKKYEKPASGPAPIRYRLPGNFIMIKLAIRNIYRYLKYKRKINTAKHRFSLLYSLEQYTGGKINLSSFKSMSLPDNSFWADPFIITKGNYYFIFFEEYLYGKNKGHISVIKMDKDGNYSTPAIVLDKSYHLSYPFVFEWQGDYYMIPETSANKTVELYKASIFPDRWEFVMNLVEDIIFIDATLLYENETWWLFGNTVVNSFTSTNDQLLLYYSKDLFSGKWTPHPQNPIATDISNCRPGGKIFRMDDDLFRPAQNNASRQYGYALSINKIKTLNETTYLEEKIAAIVPGKKNGLSAIHTFNFDKGLAVIDGVFDHG